MSQRWKYMRVGMVHCMVFPETSAGEGPVARTVQQLVDDSFFDAIEITTIKDAGVRREVRDMLASSGKTAAYCCQPVQLGNRLNLNSLETAERKRAVDACKACIAEAYELGAAALSFLSGPDPGEPMRAEATKALFESVDEMCGYAAASGDLQVILETFDRDVDKKALLGPNSEAVALAGNIRRRRDNFGLLLDMGHIPLQRESLHDAIETARQYLRQAHMGNCVLRDRAHPAYGDKHPRFGIPGGEHDVPELAAFLRELYRIGFLREERRPILSFEMKPMSGESSDQVIENAKQTLTAAWRLFQAEEHNQEQAAP